MGGKIRAGDFIFAEQLRRCLFFSESLIAPPPLPFATYLCNWKEIRRAALNLPTQELFSIYRICSIETDIFSIPQPRGFVPVALDDIYSLKRF